MKFQNTLSIGLATLVAAVLVLFSLGHAQAGEQTVGERIGTATDQAKTSIQEASTAAANKIEQIWQRIDERRLKNRTRDEIVAWALMGLLVGALASLLSVMRTGAGQRVGAVALGLVGAFIGGIVAHVAQLDFGMGPVLIRYEDLLLSLVGGLLLIFGFRFIKARRQKKV